MRAARGDNILTIALSITDGAVAEVRLPKGYSVLECVEKRGKSLILEAGEYEIIAK